MLVDLLSVIQSKSFDKSSRNQVGHHLQFGLIPGYRKNIRPRGDSDLNLQSNVYFVLAGPCDLQLHVGKELDQIPFSKCLKPGSWAISF